MHRAGASADFATLVTYVVVDGNDPLADPTGVTLLKRKQNPRVILLKTRYPAKVGVVVASPAPLEIGNYAEVKAPYRPWRNLYLRWRRWCTLRCVPSTALKVLTLLLDKDLASALFS